MLAAIAGIAFALAISGVYALLSFTIAERRRELAVRLALGANGRAIAALVLRDGFALAVAGVCVGTVIAFGLTRLLISAAVACYVPARRAMQLDPITVLRQ